jgi:hypothetical protein
VQAASEGCRRCARALQEEQRLAKHAAETAGRCGPGGGGMPTLVKPCLPQFEVRGKAGAAF